MALKKSQLYSSLWQSCDELRGGMDASQYKDYVLTLLFLKYVSDKAAGAKGSLIEVPKGASFADMVALKGDKEIGDKINKIIGKLATANDLKGVIDQADFNDESKLGSGKEMQDRLSKLVAIFDGLDFRANRAEGDDLLGDAYEYLMRHAEQDRQSQREMVTRESHYFLGRRYLLEVQECESVPGVRLAGHTTMELRVPPGCGRSHRDEVLRRWYRRQLGALLPALLAKWEPQVGKTAAEVRIRKMKTRWGCCNADARRIWLNLELIKKPVTCLEYVLVHEMVHLHA